MDLDKLTATYAGSFPTQEPSALSRPVTDSIHRLVKDRLPQTLTWGPAMAQATILAALLLLPHLAEVHNQESLLAPYMGLFADHQEVCGPSMKAIFAAAAPQTRSAAVFAVQQFVTLRLYTQRALDAHIVAATELLDLLHSANKASAQPIMHEEFYNDVVNSNDFDLSEDWRRYMADNSHGKLFSFCRYVRPFEGCSGGLCLQRHHARALCFRASELDYTCCLCTHTAQALRPQVLQVSAARCTPRCTPHRLCCRYPFLYGASAKAHFLKLDARSTMREGMLQSILHFSGSPFLVLSVRRGPELVRDALTRIRAAMSAGGGSALRKPLKVQFAGEAGVDEGGVSREFFQLIVKECFSPNYGMFEVVPGRNAFWPRPTALSDLSDEFELIGALHACMVTASRSSALADACAGVDY